MVSRAPFHPSLIHHIGYSVLEWRPLLPLAVTRKTNGAMPPCPVQNADGRSYAAFLIGRTLILIRRLALS